jgi:hypothetical protein
MTERVIVSIVSGQIMYDVPKIVHQALQLISEMQANKIPGSVTLHLDNQGNVAKIKQEKYFG